MRVSETRVPRRTFGLKKEEMVEDWRRLHNEDLHNLPCYTKQGDQVKEDEMGHAACMEEITIFS
jgi:hypothetical protein